MAKAKFDSKNPPQIRVKDLSWPLRVMITVSAVTATILLLYILLVLFYYLTSI